MMKSCHILKTIFFYSPVNRPPFSNLNPTESQFTQFFQHLSRNVKTWSESSSSLSLTLIPRQSRIDLSILILWLITSACASAAPSPTSFWQICSALSNTEAKNAGRSLPTSQSSSSVIMITMILSQPLFFLIRWLDPVPEIKYIFFQIELNEYIWIKLNGYRAIRLNKYKHIKLNGFKKIPNF